MHYKPGTTFLAGFEKELMEENKNNQRTSGNNANGIPDESNTKPMDSRKDVEQSPDEKTDQDFPGYPHYPAKEDAMNQRSGMVREDIDVENIPNSKNMTGVSQRFGSEQQPTPGSADGSGTDAPREPNQTGDDEDLGMRPGTEADVSAEERRTLEDATYYRPTNDADNLRTAHLDNTDFDGEPLNEESFGSTVSGAGLDVPGEVDETNTESMGQGDEENKYYSLGSDRQDQNEEDPYSGPDRNNGL